MDGFRGGMRSGRPRPVAGPGLHAALDALVPADLPDDALVEAIGAWERLIGGATARQAELVVELHRRREATATSRWVADEVATELVCSRRAAEVKVGLAVGLDAHPRVADALRAGLIDPRRATVLLDETMHLPVGDRGAVVDAALGDAPGLTAPQLRARIRRLELAQDADAAQRRCERERGRRRVEIQPTADAMAWLSAYLPADEAMATWTALTAMADAQADDDRPVDARRADALVDTVTRWLDAGTTPDGEPLPTSAGRRPHLQLTADATTVLGLDDTPGDLAGFGPVPADTVRRIAGRATWEPLLVDAGNRVPLARGTRRYEPTRGLRDAVAARDVTCTFPGCRTSAVRCDLDHVVPFAPVDGRGDVGTEQTTVDNLHALCRHHHAAKTHAGWSIERDLETQTTWWTSPSGRRRGRAPAQLLTRTVDGGPPGVLIDLGTAPPRRPRRSGTGPPDSRPPPF